MTKLMGSLMIILSSVVLGIKRVRFETQHLETLESIAQMLKCLRGELKSYQTPLPQLLRNIAHHSSGAAQEFLNCMNINLSKLGELEFAAIWEISARKTMESLNAEELTALVNLGKSLGHYELETQVQEVDWCISHLEKSIFNIHAKLPEMRKLYLGISGAIGVILVILLV